MVFEGLKGLIFSTKKVKNPTLPKAGRVGHPKNVNHLRSFHELQRFLQITRFHQLKSCGRVSHPPRVLGNLCQSRDNGVEIFVRERPPPMPTRNVNLTNELDRFVSKKVKTGRYENASEVVRAGLRTLEREERQYEAKLAALRAAIDEGDASGIAKANVFRRVRKSLKLPASSR